MGPVVLRGFGRPERVECMIAELVAGATDIAPKLRGGWVSYTITYEDGSTQQVEVDVRHCSDVMLRKARQAIRDKARGKR